MFSNLDGLFAFHTSAEDAEYLAEELGGGLDKQDLLELGHYQCYARMTDTRTGERLPTFTVQLDAPPVGDPRWPIGLPRRLRSVMDETALDVELDLQAAAERINGPEPGAPSEQTRRIRRLPCQPRMRRVALRRRAPPPGRRCLAVPAVDANGSKAAGIRTRGAEAQTAAALTKARRQQRDFGSQHCHAALAE